MGYKDYQNRAHARRRDAAPLPHRDTVARALAKSKQATRDYTTAVDRDGNDLPAPIPALCGDCSLPVYYDYADENYHHAVYAARGCFLIGPEDRPDDLAHPLASTPLVWASQSQHTWQGRPGFTATAYRNPIDIDTVNERVVIIRWGDGPITLRHITGDGRSASFVIHDEVEVDARFAPYFDVDKYARERLYPALVER